jgi:glycosyltransferase involved in cell wall biosynthesis
VNSNALRQGPLLTDAAYKLLYIAYACEPGRGSEWGLGWSYVEELARTQPVWVIVHDDCRAGLESFLKTRHTGHPIYPIFVKLPAWLGWMRNSFYTLFNLHYYLWQFAAARALRRVHAQVKLDLVQHVSLFRWWMPSAGAALADDGVGFIFGPVGGGEVLPKNFRSDSPLYGKFSDLLRYIARSIWRHDPLLTRCIEKAHLLIAGTPACEAWFRTYKHKNIELVCSAASSEVVSEVARQARLNRPTNQPFTFASCGGLAYYRGVDLAIRAFARAKLSDARYVHICDGPMRASLEKLCVELGVADRVTFMGDIPHVDCVRVVAQADACVHTVLRDSQGVLCEVMLAGTPVITLNHLTPAMLVTPECGHLIAMHDTTTREDVIDELCNVMRQWHNDPALIARKGAAAAERAKTFSPQIKGELYRQQHQRVLAMLKPAQSAAVSVKTTPAPHAA